MNFLQKQDIAINDEIEVRYLTKIFVKANNKKKSYETDKKEIKIKKLLCLKRTSNRIVLQKKNKDGSTCLISTFLDNPEFFLNISYHNKKTLRFHLESFENKINKL